MYNNIGNARRAYAGKHGKFTQRDAARCFGVSLSTYCNWEQGKVELNGAQLEMIAEKYGVTTDYLLARDDTRYAFVSIGEDDGSIELVGLWSRLAADDRAAILHIARGLAR